MTRLRAVGPRSRAAGHHASVQYTVSVVLSSRLFPRASLQVFGPDSLQEKVYNQAIVPIVQEVGKSRRCAWAAVSCHDKFASVLAVSSTAAMTVVVTAD
jgi:hypothetical protein